MKRTCEFKYDGFGISILLTINGRPYGRYLPRFFESRWGYPSGTIVGDFTPL